MEILSTLRPNKSKTAPAGSVNTSQDQKKTGGAQEAKLVAGGHGEEQDEVLGS